MRNVLVLGGTAWVGREIAAAAIARGDRVTCLARGSSGGSAIGGIAEGSELIESDRSAPGAYDRVLRDWDEVIEISWNPSFAYAALDALAPRAAHWSLISTISVYASNAEPGADESAEVVEPDDPEDYGKAKVAVEQASAAALTDRLLIVRPGLIVGPGDTSDRFGYWVARMSLAGSEPVLAPSTVSPSGGERVTQVIDVRDLAAFVAGASGSGILNAVGDALPLGRVLDRAASVAGFTAARVEATDAWLLDHDVNYWAGPRSLPLWLPPEDAAMTNRGNRAILAAGAHLRDLDETLVDTLADESERGLDRPRRAGLTRGDELALLGELADS